jgi:hypothetical protein
MDEIKTDTTRSCVHCMDLPSVYVCMCGHAYFVRHLHMFAPTSVCFPSSTFFDLSEISKHVSLYIRV